MKRWCLACCTTALLASVLPVGTAVAAKNDLEQAMSYDGLSKIKVKDVDLVYARPGASLAGYNGIKLDPVEVAFRKDWNPERTGSRIKVSTQERESIRTGVAKIVHDEFVKELQSTNRYKVVAESAPDVLRVKVNIVNLYVNAPDTGGAGRSRTYTISSGEMTIALEAFDSESGQILARMVDRREARNNHRMMLSTGGENMTEAAAIANTWARVLRKGLERASESGRK